MLRNCSKDKKYFRKSNLGKAGQSVSKCFFFMSPFLVIYFLKYILESLHNFISLKSQ